MRIQRLVLVILLVFLPSDLVAQTLVGSKKSNKYHYRHCRSAQTLSAENRIEFRSTEEAVAAGYMACKVCKPPAPKTKAVQRTAPTERADTLRKASEETRCKAITKAGTQCKRKALAGSSYCAQHKK